MKSQVKYKPTDKDYVHIGQRALLWNVLDHPSLEVSNTPGTPVSTSQVRLIQYHGGKILYFETLNTIYFAELRGSAKKEGITNIDDLE